MRIVSESNQASTPSIRMGEMALAVGAGELRTLVGSCVGLALHDRKRKVGGIAHIVLPESPDQVELPGKYVDTAIPALLAAMSKAVAEEVQPVAKIAGGASMFATTITRNIGEENVAATERWLKKLGIPILAKDCGGEKGRRMSLDVRTGNVLIEIAGRAPLVL